MGKFIHHDMVTSLLILYYEIVTTCSIITKTKISTMCSSTKAGHNRDSVNVKILHILAYQHSDTEQIIKVKPLCTFRLVPKDIFMCGGLIYRLGSTVLYVQIPSFVSTVVYILEKIHSNF